MRRWLIENDFQGLEGQKLPLMSDQYINGVSERYIELYEAITAERFIKANTQYIQERIQQNVNTYLANL